MEKPNLESKKMHQFHFLLSVLFSCTLLYMVESRGGEHPSFSSGFANTSYVRTARHLFDAQSSKRFDLASGYMTNSALGKAMKDFSHRCSNISRMYSIGESVMGVPLWVLEISDNPGKEEAEPAFKFVGNVHGDEPVGRELLMLLANWICDNYPKDPLVKLIVDNVHLHILPTMNPDGYTLKSRGNANNIDLNRDFPDQFFPENNKVDKRQPETRAIMKWLKEIRFTASASLHGGALVANYPWDGTDDKRRNYYACPDDETFRFMASIYSRSHFNMSLSKEFEGGITNGAAWYPIYGGMQDWNYIHAGCFELTLEISDNKWPRADELPTIWEHNKMSMLNLVASVAKTGIHGRIYSSDSGKALPASVTINGINYTVKAGNAYADYHRMLAPGEKYEVVASMAGYKPKSTTIKLEDTANAMTVDFILDPEEATTMGKNRVESLCDCDCTYKGWFEQRESLLGTRMVVYFVVIIGMGFICFLTFRRRVKGRQAGGPKRTAVV